MSKRCPLRITILGQALARKAVDLELLPSVPQTNTGARVE